MFGCIKLHRVPVLSEPPSLPPTPTPPPRRFRGARTRFGVSRRRRGPEFRGARPSPGTNPCPRGYASDSDHLAPRHAPAMPACLAGHAPPPLLLRAAGRGRWVMVTQIITHHTAYLQSTPSSGASGVSHRSNKYFVSLSLFHNGHVLFWSLM